MKPVISILTHLVLLLFTKGFSGLRLQLSSQCKKIRSSFRSCQQKEQHYRKLEVFLSALIFLQRPYLAYALFRRMPGCSALKTVRISKVRIDRCTQNTWSHSAFTLVQVGFMRVMISLVCCNWKLHVVMFY